jgi:hypothetical protein
MSNFDNIQSLDLSQVKQDVSFPISRMDLVTEDPHSETKYQMVRRDDIGKNLGLIKETHPTIPYGDIMDWLTTEFGNAGVAYKLRDSVVKNDGTLFQEYIFDYDIDPPDGEEISPLVIMKSSYVGAPLDVYFGTYRFVCSNGVMVGETIQKIHVNARSSDILNSSIQDDIRASLAKFDKVAGLYKELTKQDFNPYLDAILVNTYISTGVKKMVLEELQNQGSVELLKEKIKAEDFNENFRNRLLNVVDEITAWEFYNIVTNIATRKSNTVASRLGNFTHISKSFGI